MSSIRSRMLVAIFISLIAIILLNCSEKEEISGPSDTTPPMIDSVKPNPALFEDTVRIYGSHFGKTISENSVKFATILGLDITATIQSASEELLIVGIPDCAVAGLSVTTVNGSDTIALIIEIGRIRGIYEGIYERIKNFSLGDVGWTLDNQYIEWTFSDTRFWCQVIDTMILPRFVCDFVGFYHLQPGIPPNILLNDTIVAVQPCNHADIPVNEFLIYNCGDTMFIEQYDSDIDVFKSIRISKIE